MAYQEYHGKDTAVTIDTVAVNGVRKVTIDEKAKPLPDQMDTTVCGDSAWSFTADPLGGKGLPKSTVTITGLASQTDVADSGLYSLTLGNTYDIVVDPAGSTTGYDRYTLSDAYLQARNIGPEYNNFVPFSITFEKDAAGTWGSVP